MSEDNDTWSESDDSETDYFEYDYDVDELEKPNKGAMNCKHCDGDMPKTRKYILLA